MTFTHDTPSTQFFNEHGRLERPRFSSHITSDRLRESERAISLPKTGTGIKMQRRSVFREEGLDDMELETNPYIDPETKLEERKGGEGRQKKAKVTFEHILQDLEPTNMANKRQDKREDKRREPSLLSKIKARPMIKTRNSAPPGLLPTRTTLLVLLLCVLVPGWRYGGGAAVAGVIRGGQMVENGGVIEARQNSPTEVCTRWAHQGMLFWSRDGRLR
jgi:hypothetical protein